jgi:hypothetical protein
MSKRTLLALGPAIWVLIFGFWIGPKYDRFVLPAFDGHVYDAMAESPRVFTLAPWGYRILEPWLVHLLPFSSSAAGFFWLNLVLLSGAVFITGSWLRRLGFSSTSAALASMAFALSPPVRLILHYQVLVDPLAVFLLTVLLHELVDPDPLVVMALGAAAALTKETCLLFLTLIPFSFVPRLGPGRGLFDSAAVSAPAIFISVVIRLTWGRLAPPASPLSLLELTIGHALESLLGLATAAALSGLILPVGVGFFRESSVGLRLQGALMWIFTFSLILANPYHYSVSDLPRLALFAWPPLLPIALAGLGFKRTPTAEPDSRGRLSFLAAPLSLSVLAICALMVALTDPYRRAPFGPDPDPVTFVGRVRETLKTARALDRGETFVFEAGTGRFSQPVEQTFNLTDVRRQRWFLYRGFGRGAAFSSGVPSFMREAQLLLPVLTPFPLNMSVEFEGAANAEVEVSVGGRRVARVHTGHRGASFLIPPNLLIRGDNLIGLRESSGARVELVRFTVRVETRPIPGVRKARPGSPLRS